MRLALLPSVYSSPPLAVSYHVEEGRDLFSESLTKVLTQSIQMTGVFFFPHIGNTIPFATVINVQIHACV